MWSIVWRWGLWEIIRVKWDHNRVLMRGLGSLEEKTRKLALSLHPVRIQQESGHLLPGERKKALTRPWICWHHQPPELWEISACCSSHPDYDILVWQPESTVCCSFCLFILKKKKLPFIKDFGYSEVQIIQDEWFFPMFTSCQRMGWFFGIF